MPSDVSALDDPLWLEEVEGDDALAQVRTWNAATLQTLEADPRFAQLEAAARAILEAPDRIPYAAYRGGHVYNFWQDETRVRGLVRRTSLRNYAEGDDAWEPLLDVDALAEGEGENWVYKGSASLPPNHTRAVVALSRGGKDAAVRREWDHNARAFVEGGFELPEAKASVAWAGPNELYVATDWGPGALTDSGYPFIVKSLRRGQTLDEAYELYRGEPTDVGVWPVRVEGDDGPIMLISRSVTFFESETHILDRDRGAVRLPLPARATPRALFKGQFVFTIEEDWTPHVGGAEHPRGALLAFPLEELLRTGVLPPVSAIFTPGPRAAVEAATAAKSRLLVVTSVNVQSRAYRVDWEDGTWTLEDVALPPGGSIGLVSANRETDVVFVNYESHVTPPTLHQLDAASGKVADLRKLAERYDASGLKVSRHEATSADGERVPYTLIRRADAPDDGTTPTVLYGYGGFQIALTPAYAGVRGKLWLERGGAFAIAHIRGGGEFGPAWHEAARKTNRQKAFDDFIAVAEDLVATGATSPRRLGIMGGSNGGLLVGAAITQRPDLFHAAVCQVPLLDMLRYHELLAGASWIDEYGDPRDPAERAALEKISPFHRLDAGANYPEIFLVTSTKDDRVHPGHARKFAKRLEDFGKAFFYYENIDGGHSAAANLRETARRSALEYVYLARKLMD